MTWGDQKNCHLCGKKKQPSGGPVDFHTLIDFNSQLPWPDCGKTNYWTLICGKCNDLYTKKEDLNVPENDKKVKTLVKQDQLKKLEIIEKYLKENPDAPDYLMWKREAQLIREEYNLPKEQPEQQQQRERERDEFPNYEVRYSS